MERIRASNWKRALLGPELIWLLVYGTSWSLGLWNRPWTGARNQQIEAVGWLLPFGGAIVSFLPFAWNPVRRWWLLARTLVVGLIAVFPVTTTLCTAMLYHDSRDTGVGVAWMLFLSLGIGALLIGFAITAFFLLTKWRFGPWLKWSSVAAAALALLWIAISWLASLG